MSLATLWTLRVSLLSAITWLGGCNIATAFRGDLGQAAYGAAFTLLFIASLAAIERLATLARIPGSIQPAPRPQPALA
ncbi:hypothetical protein [Falsiroseomonas oryziterrae]|uniref:hypothetical protein n=1 Tax=Falsiroseomonas oryziterrae TaxID=2911368 RepID=UPI001F22B554|nr:hypothetical protein [Roseomonas sp. NPKOSM-4]